MSQSYNNQQQPWSHTQNSNAGYNSEPMMNLSTSPVANRINVGEQQWKHFSTNISPSVSNKLTIIGIFYILIGILSIGLEVGLLINERFSYIAGFINGFFLFSIGILTLILCRQQVYVLTSLFVLVFFQLLFTIATFVVYSIMLYIVAEGPASCSPFYGYCNLSSTLTILSTGVCHVFITFCIVTVNLVIIKDARQPPIFPLTPSYVVYAPYTQTMSAASQNPCVTAMNDPSSA